MARAVTESDNVLKELPAIVQWLNNLGLSMRSSRYTQYREIIRKFFEEKYDLETEEGNVRFELNFREMNQAYIECISVFLIYKCFKDVTHPSFVAKLKKVVSGQPVPDLTDAGESRNFLFELLVAARFSLSGYAINFDGANDVVATKDNLIVRIECKRLTSEKQLRKRINKAAEQLLEQATVRTGEGREVVGMIFLDISSCLSNKVQSEVTSADGAANEMRRAVEDFITTHALSIEKLNERHLGASYATCLMATLPIWSSDFVMHASTNTAVRIAEKMSVEREVRLRRVLAGFNSGVASIF